MLIAVLLALMTAGPTLKTPETSTLFERFADPESGVISYVLKPGLTAWNQQSLYFTQKSMTDDGRFLVYTVADDERKVTLPKGSHGMPRHLAIVDFLSDKAYQIEDDIAEYSIPYVDCREDRIYYVNDERNAFCRRDLLVDPRKEIELFKMPKVAPEGMRLRSWYTHLTLSTDRTVAFLDIWCKDKNGKPHCQEGLLSLKDGTFTKWCDLDFLADHGQINPSDNSLALGAWEGVKTEKVNGVPQYRRMWLYTAKGEATNIPSKDILHATHEAWSDDGKSFYWCSRDPARDKYGVYRYDLATKTETCVASEKAMHAMISPDNTKLVYDWPLPPLGRGSPWSVSYKDLKTGRVWKIFSRRPGLVEPGQRSTLHPDPHPQFVMNAKYIVSTMNGDDHRMNLAITPVAQFAAP